MAPLIEGVLEGDLDLAMISLPVRDDPRLYVEPLFSEPLLLVVAKGHPLTEKPQVTAADLAGETFVMMGTASSLSQQVKSFCGDHHFEPRIAFRCSQIPTVKALVALGAGVSILPRLARTAQDEESLVYLNLADDKPSRGIAVVRHMQRYQSRGAEQFLAVLRERASELVTH